MKVNVYIDGLNLFNGCVRRSPYRWLDVRKLAEAELPGDEIAAIRYFTARYKSPPSPMDRLLRQDIYIRALRTIPGVTVREGKFLRGTTVEKGTDVNIACAMIIDALNGSCERMALISNDSDLCEPIRIVQNRFGIPVIVLHPCLRDDRKPSGDLARTAGASKQIFGRSIRQSLLAREITDRNGTIRMPEGWDLDEDS